jgi:hypothetical protein
MTGETGPAGEVDRCEVCYRRFAPGDRFCSACGAAVGSSGSTGTTPDGVMLIDPSPDDGHPAGSVEASEAVVRTGLPGGARSPLAVAGLVVVVIGLGWLLFRQPAGTETAQEPSAAESGDQPAPAANGEGSTDGDETTGAVSPGGAAPTGGAASPAGAVSPGGAVSPAEGASPSGEAIEVEAALAPTGAPVVGERTGLALVYRRAPDSRGLRHVDLDTGEVHDIDFRSDTLLGAVGSTLVASRLGEVFLVDLAGPEVADPELRARPFAPGSLVEQGGVLAVGRDRIWYVSGTDTAGLELIGFDLDGTETSRTQFGFASVLQLPGTLIFEPAGGVYRRRADGAAEWLGRGELLAEGDTLALVRQCDPAMICTRAWVDVASWEPVDRPPPQLGESRANMLQIVGDRTLVARWFDLTGVTTRYFDIETGALAFEQAAQDGPDFGLESSLPISADGRWLATIIDRALVIVDLTSGRQWAVPTPDSVGEPWVSATFVDTGR